MYCIGSQYYSYQQWKGGIGVSPLFQNIKPPCLKSNSTVITEDKTWIVRYGPQTQRGTFASLIRYPRKCIMGEEEEEEKLRAESSSHETNQHGCFQLMFSNALETALRVWLSRGSLLHFIYDGTEIDVDDIKWNPVDSLEIVCGFNGGERRCCAIVTQLALGSGNHFVVVSFYSTNITIRLKYVNNRSNCSKTVVT